ncbi:tryptophan synthase subunit beta [Verminephrobacter eiseniae]|uniref:tryptophan synthase subunit beta n=1 Tax=Verminephrobacter eiseniae TaxID=364317 RepID=UPI002238C416|nr:tryptophan synthase subunit beta [Verminephrobacter eiseniae]MCW5236758.1 tryptophan synthase subunit beta [Verminephrobacter eiseniae]
MTSYQQPDAAGHFGPYGGSFVSETLTLAIAQLRAAYAHYQNDPEFLAEFGDELKHFVGRPAPIYHAARSSREIGGAQIYLKREDLNHTGAHKINNVIGQAMLARRMGKPRVIAETGAGQHGVAAATICARYGLECVVYMGAQDVRRQSPNVYRMKLLGATVVPVESGSRTLKDALNEAMRDWVTHVDDTFYIIGSVAGPHPYPMMVRDFQSIIGKECIEQMPAMLARNEAAGQQPDAVIACVGGGSNAMGIFHPYIPFAGTRLIGVEAAGLGLESGKHSASLQKGSPGVLHGSRTFVLQDANGQITETHSISAGLDYPGVGPEHAWLQQIGRAEYVGITDQEALDAFHFLCRTEGIIPALESSHAVAHALKLAKTMRPDQSILVNLSGRGDKDIGTVADLSGADFYCRPSCHGQSVKGGSQ